MTVRRTKWQKEIKGSNNLNMKYVQWAKLESSAAAGRQRTKLRTQGETNKKIRIQIMLALSLRCFFTLTKSMAVCEAVNALELDFSCTWTQRPLKPESKPGQDEVGAERGTKRKRSQTQNTEVKRRTACSRWWIVSAPFTLSQQISGRGSLAIPGLPRLMFRET